jgi:hypothetical protein
MTPPVSPFRPPVLGLAYPVDAVQDLVRALGDQRARHALFSARELSAARQWKLAAC